MPELKVIYWTMTGNTRIMADCLAEGAKQAGAKVQTMEVGQATPADALLVWLRVYPFEQLKTTPAAELVKTLEEAGAGPVRSHLREHRDAGAEKGGGAGAGALGPAGEGRLPRPPERGLHQRARAGG